MKRSLISSMLALSAAVIIIPTINAQETKQHQQEAHADVAKASGSLAGRWTVRDTQGGTGSACVTIVGSGRAYTYTSSSGDSGTVLRINGGWVFQSAEGGGNGLIQESDGTYAWHNAVTGAGGTMTRGC